LNIAQGEEEMAKVAASTENEAGRGDPRSAAPTVAPLASQPRASPSLGVRWRAFVQPRDRLFIGGTSLFLFGAFWELAADSGLVDPLFISSPSRIATVGWQLAFDDDFWRDLKVSSTEFLTGYGTAILLGIPIGLATAWYRRLDYLFGPFIDMLNAVPRVTFLPIIVVWFGIGIWSKFAVVLLGAVIPIIISTHVGVKTNEQRFLTVARSFGATQLKLFTSIILPGTVPFIFTGLKYGAARALLGVVVGELYAATAGIGHMIAEAGNTFQTDTLFFGVLLFTGTGLAITTALDRVERHFQRWRPEGGGTR
jgi:ABC-type nitrate/sulfonate/bicarbonate transport system permease component